MSRTPAILNALRADRVEAEITKVRQEIARLEKSITRLRRLQSAVSREDMYEIKRIYREYSMWYEKDDDSRKYEADS